MDEKTLKPKLAEIKANGFAPPASEDLQGLVDSMLTHIGAVDPELRDHLIYQVFCEWVMGGVLSQEQVLHILDTCLGKDFLEYQIEDETGDGVFKRSFSALGVALVLEYNRQVDFLSRDRIDEIFDRLCSSYEQERNLVGYYPGKGWAHTAAHTVDGFEGLADSRFISREQLEKMLELFRRKFQRHTYLFIDGEDSRTAAVVKKMLEGRDDAKDLVLAWVEAMVEFEKVPYPEVHILKGNIRNLLRSVYFCTKDAEVRERVETVLEMVAI